MFDLPEIVDIERRPKGKKHVFDLTLRGSGEREATLRGLTARMLLTPRIVKEKALEQLVMCPMHGRGLTDAWGNAVAEFLGEKWGQSTPL